MPKVDTEPHRTALSLIPKVHALLEMRESLLLADRYGRRAVTDAIRAELDGLRKAILANGHGGAIPTAQDLLSGVGRRLAEQGLSRLTRVINATGILLHTNMGRAPLAEEAVNAVVDVARGYSNLEIDLLTGKRGARGGDTEELLKKLTGAEAVLVVNNNAAGVLLALTTIAKGAKVLISRGELVEIGGSFRVPDVIAQSGAELVEVGTTNKTHLADYARAISGETRVILKVHPSNYRIVGFTSDVGVRELSGLAAEHELILMNDLGSGALVDLSRWGLPHEPTVGEALAAGADIVTVSGDKLLGGPQCGLILGKTELIRRMGANPLFRALRAGKMALSALAATLLLYLDEDHLAEKLPVLAMLAQSQESLLLRARRLRARLARIEGITAAIEDGEGFAGGGSLPEAVLPTKRVKVRVEGVSPDQAAGRLRRGSPPIVGMVADDSFVLDMRTVRDWEVAEIAAALARLSP